MNGEQKPAWKDLSARQKALGLFLCALIFGALGLLFWHATFVEHVPLGSVLHGVALNLTVRVVLFVILGLGSAVVVLLRRR